MVVVLPGKRALGPCFLCDTALLRRQSIDRLLCTALGYWDTGLKPTLPERSAEAVAGDTQPG